MKRDRDRIAEIAEVNRRQATRNLIEIASRIDALEHRLSEHAQDIEVLKYLPVAITTVLEVHTKACIQSLIDDEERVALRAEATVRFDPPIILALVGKKISFGEIIAHSFTPRSLSNVNAYISKLIDEDFLEALKTVDDRFMADRRKQSGEIVLDDPSNVYKTLNEVFTVRHIVVHEIPKELNLDQAAILGQIRAAKVYLRAANSFIQHRSVQRLLEAEERRKKVFKDIAQSTSELLRHAAVALANYLTKRPRDDQVVEMYHKAGQRWKLYQSAEMAWIERLFKDDPFCETTLSGYRDTIGGARAGMLVDVLTELQSADD